jgi:two-component system response regulator FixJ
MVNYTKQHIFFVDDEPAVREVIGETLKEVGFKVSCFTRADDCLEQLNAGNCDLLITDVKMPEMDGIELLNRTKRVCPWLPVLVITGYGDIPMAVKALKAGAADFIEKPLSRENFITVVESILRKNARSLASWDRKLTKAEVKVLRLVLDGRSNIEIARLLNRSVRTIEDHRNKMMHKLGAHNLADLLRKSVALGLL